MHKEKSLGKGEKQQNPVVFFIIFIAAIVAVGLAGHFLTGRTFLDSKNIMIIITSSVYPTFIAWALCFLFACGYTDLSIGAVVILGSFACVTLGNLYGYPGVIVGGLVVGAVLIFINFVIFAFSKIPSWIASISLALIYEAIAVYIRGHDVSRPHVDAELLPELRLIGQMPINVILLAAGFVVVYFIYNRTSIGLNIRAIGGSMDVSRALGVNILKTLLWVGLICGLLIGTSAVIQQSYSIRTSVLPGLTSIIMLFKPLAITLLAQILQKRINIIIAVPFCSIIVFGVFNLMTFFRVQSGTLQELLLCIFLIAFGVIGQRGVKEVVK